MSLTGITDEMVADAPSPEEVPSFWTGRGTGCLVAHNAEFDVGFVRAGCRRMGRTFDNTLPGRTLILCQNLLPQLNKYKLDIIASPLDLPSFNHHRATDDAEDRGLIFWPLYKNLRIWAFGPCSRSTPMRSLRSGGRKKRGQAMHRKSSDSAGQKSRQACAISISWFLWPIWNTFKPISHHAEILINENREGLIIGSACEAGELFQAILDGKSEDELKRIASWYDYLEIQPICQQPYMLPKEGIVEPATFTS